MSDSIPWSSLSSIPWGRFHFIGYTIAISIVCSVAILDTIIFFCTMNGLLPIYVRSWKKKICFYSTVMFTLGTCLIIFGALALAEKHTEKEILEFMTSKWKDMNATKTKENAKQFWDNVQIEYSCCGFNSANDYASNLPKSCCSINANTCTIQNAYKISCFDAVIEYFNGVLLIILVTMAFAMACVCFLLILLARASIRICGLSDHSADVSVL